MKYGLMDNKLQVLGSLVFEAVVAFENDFTKVLILMRIVAWPLSAH